MPAWLIALSVVAGLYVVALVGLVAFGKPSTAKQLATFVPYLVLLFKDLVRDPRVSRWPKVLVAVSIVWIASPIDLIPEFIPVLGPLDDALVAALALRAVVRSAGREVVAEHWRGERGSLDLLLRLAGGGTG